MEVSEACLNQKKSEADPIVGYCIIFAIFIAGLTVSSVISSKIIVIASITLPASVFVWAMTYPCSDIVAEVYGRKFANKMVLGGLIAYILFICAIQISIYLEPAPLWQYQNAYENTLKTGLRPAIATLVSYVITQFCDVYFFHFIRKKTNGEWLWMRNNGSTFLSQTMSNAIFLTIGFWGTMPIDNWLQLFMNNLSVRYLLVASDTLLVYAGVYTLYKIFPTLRLNRHS